MSCQAYLAIRQYKDEAEKEAVRKEAYSKMWRYIDKDGDYFDEDRWRDHCFDFVEELEMYSSDLTTFMIQNNSGFVPDDVIDNFRAKTGQDFLIKKGEKDTDGLRVVSISKEDVIRLIRSYCQSIADSYKKMLSLAKDPNWLNMDELQTRLDNRVKDWEGTAIRGIKLNKDDKVEIPYPLAWSYEFLIAQLIEIVNKYDWSCVDAVLYGG